MRGKDDIRSAHTLPNLSVPVMHIVNSVGWLVVVVCVCDLEIRF